MDDSEQQPSSEEAGAQSLAGEVRELFEAARERAETELAFQKARGALAGKWIGIGAGLGCLALMLLFVALMGAVFGVVLALAQTFGAWLATGIVAGSLLLLAVIAALLALGRFKRTAALLKDRP